MPYTQVEAVGDFDGAVDRWCCNDCGAHATSIDSIKHHATCVPGESKKWEDFYEAANEEEKLFDEEEQMMDLMAEYESESHCNVCTAVDEIGIDACSGCCRR